MTLCYVLEKQNNPRHISNCYGVWQCWYQTNTNSRMFYDVIYTNCYLSASLFKFHIARQLHAPSSNWQNNNEFILWQKILISSRFVESYRLVLSLQIFITMVYRVKIWKFPFMSSIIFPSEASSKLEHDTKHTL